MTAEMVAQDRRFNRTVTQRIGALNENFLSRHRPLGQKRLLWEIGADGCDIRSLRLMRLEARTNSRRLSRCTERYIEVKPFNDEPYADHWFEQPL